MKLRRSDDLEKQFGDAQLEPHPEFIRQLSGQLELSNGPKKYARLNRRVVLATGGALVLALALVALPLLRPVPTSNTSKPLARTILLKDLYATAMADELPKQSATTFWDVTQTDNGGPAMASCNSNVQPYTEHDLFFMKDNVTAMWSTATNGFTGMYYSDDADVPAFNTDALTTAQNGQFSWALNHGKLTDVNGKPLPGDAATAIKSSGTYEIYATYPTLDKATNKPLASCQTRMMDLKIDAATGMFTEADEYNGSIAPDKLVDSAKQTIKTATGSFADVEPKFDAMGFNLAQAKANTVQFTTKETNVAGGYEFWYHKSIMGVPTLSQEKNSDGSTGVYAYSFAKQPDVKYRLYTAKAENQVPKDLADLKSMATAQGWQVLVDDTQPGIGYPGYSNATTELYEASDGTTEYLMFATGTPDVPYVYIEMPLDSSAAGDIDLLSNVMLFKPGTTPPAPVS